jgi:hypothetical protein
MKVVAQTIKTVDLEQGRGGNYTAAKGDDPIVALVPQTKEDYKLLATLSMELEACFNMLTPTDDTPCFKLVASYDNMAYVFKKGSKNE